MSSFSIVHAVRSDGFAGVERHVCVLARAQVRVGHAVFVIGGDPSVMPGELGREIDWAPARRTADVVRALRRVRDADIVHAHMTAAEAAAALTLRGSTRLVVTRHFAGVRGRSGAGAAIAPLIRHRLSEQIAVSRYVASRVDGASTVVYPAVESHSLGSAGARGKVILAAQRLEPEKGADVVIRSFARSGLAADGWALKIVGDGSCRGELELLARQEGVHQHVDFTGQRRDVQAMMARSSIFMSACPVEGLGLAVVEAMAAGLPVVTTAAGGHLETVGLSGDQFLFDPYDHEAAASMLAQLAGNPGLRAAVGSQLQALQREHFSPQRQERDTAAVYERALR